MLHAALLDMYNGEPNRGIPMLQSMLGRYANVLRFKHFDVRAKEELPDLSFNIYVFSGGPGDPLLREGPWFEAYFKLIEALWQWNKQASREEKKYCFFICHSFQMACHHFGLGQISRRKSMSFGTFPVHKTYWGKREAFFEGLSDPFYIADFRHFQVLHPDRRRFRETGANLLCLETLSPQASTSERAMMAVRFSPEMFGTQFHPEADPAGLLEYFREPERKKTVVEEYGEARYERMIRDLANPLKIQRTYDTVIPKFLENAVEQLTLQLA